MEWFRNNRWHLLAIGLIQGLIFSYLWRTFDFEGDLAIGVRIVADLLLAIPILIYATENIPGLTNRARALIIAGITGVAIALQEYGVYVYDSTTWGSWFPQVVIPTLILMFVSVHWLMHWRRVNPSNHAYRDLFQSTWRNAILCGLGVALTGVFWIVLTAGGALFKLIGIDALQDLIRRSWFAIPATTTVFAMVVSLGLLREEMIESLRKLLLGLLKWFLPLVLVLAAVWTLALPFTGLETLFKTRSAAWTMLGTMALSILFANAAYQDGRHGKEYPRTLGRVLQWLWLALIPVAGIAIWALLLRIGQYDWTAQRMWGFFVALQALGYAIGYSLSVFKRQAEGDWMESIAGTNRIMALVLVGGIIALLSPILDANRTEASRQAKRIAGMDVQLKKGKLDKIVPDFNFVSRTGRFGVEQGRKLEHDASSLKPGTAKAVAVLLPAQWEAIKSNAAKPIKFDQKTARIMVINPDQANAALLTWLQSKLKDPKRDLNGCFAQDVCNVYWLDLNADGQSEALLFEGKNESYPSVYTWNGTQGRYVGMLNSRSELPQEQLPLLPMLKSGNTELVDSPWKRVRVGDVEFGVD